MRTKFETITPAAGSSVGEAVVTAALSQKGLPYSWGGGTPTGPSEGFGRGAGIVGFDCSSLVQYAVYQATGGKLRLPRVSQEQSRTGQGIASGRGRDINMALLAPGDAIGIDAESNGDVEHIAVYMGNNKIVHAPKPGDVVKESDLSDNYYANATWHVRRYV
jgi:cell wall-associated NlpC family hydrolase